ncbi:protein BTG2-like [Cryptotermes secundus]|nr:protein BTG2-like [Cryptotermes secundus]
MRLEIHSAANFLVHLLRLHHNGLTESQLEMFKCSLTDVLRLRYQEHWFPEKPARGSGYRCIRINGKMDPVIAQAGTAVGLPASYLHSLFPSELTMWIDPAEVSYRIGENGSICVLYEESNSGQGAEDLGLERVTNADGTSGSSGSSSSNTTSSTSGCKESMRTIEFFLDPRGVQPFEQLAAFVSS